MRVSRPGRPALAGSLLIRNVEVQAAACRDRVDQGLQLGGGGALDHAVHQRCSTVQGESQTRTARNARGQDGAGRGRAAGLTETGQFLGTLHYVVPEQIMWGSEIRFGMSCEVVTQRCSPRGRVHGETKTERSRHTRGLPVTAVQGAHSSASSRSSTSSGTPPPGLPKSTVASCGRRSPQAPRSRTCSSQAGHLIDQEHLDVSGTAPSPRTRTARSSARNVRFSRSRCMPQLWHSASM